MTNKKMSCPQCGRRFAEPADRCDIDGAPLYGPEVMQRLGLALGSYKIHHILGEGGMGVVYRGEHAMLGKPVAVKVLHDRFARREGSLEQFLREARAASRIRHPNIVDVTDFGTAPDGCVFFVMEYLEGESLEDILARQHRIDLFSSVNIVRQVAQALAAAHDHAIVHLDLKPENVFLINQLGRRRIVRRGNSAENDFVVEPEGKFNFVKLLDFGVAKFVDSAIGEDLMPSSGMVFGTPHYMSPEQARGDRVDARSDVYSLGILFYEMLTGDIPFDGEEAAEILNAHVSAPVPPPMERQPDLEIDANTNETVLRCLEKDPADRYQTMDELLEALQLCFTDRVFLRHAHHLPGAVESGIVPPRPPPRRPPRTPGSGSHGAGHEEASLTDQLSTLFSSAKGGQPTDDVLDDDRDPSNAAVEDGAVRDQEPTLPVAPRQRPTSPGIGVAPARGDHNKAKRQRRVTEPLSSKGGG